MRSLSDISLPSKWTRDIHAASSLNLVAASPLIRFDLYLTASPWMLKALTIRTLGCLLCETLDAYTADSNRRSDIAVPRQLHDNFHRQDIGRVSLPGSGMRLDLPETFANRHRRQRSRTGYHQLPPI